MEEPEWMRKLFDREEEPEVIGESIAVIQSLLRVARAAYAYDYCNDDDIERKGFLLKRMRKDLKEVKDIL